MIAISKSLIYTFNDRTIDFKNKAVYYDTSMILKLIGYSDDNNLLQEVNDFDLRVAGDSGISVSTQKCWEELAIQLTTGKINALNTTGERNKKKVIARNPGMMAVVANTVEQIQGYFDADPNHVIFEDAVDSGVRKQALDLMKKADLGYPDAVHVVMATNLGADFIATTDSDYANIPNSSLKIITDSNTFKKIHGGTFNKKP